MDLLKRYRVRLVLVAMAVLVVILVVYKLKDQQARAVTRARPDVLVGVVTPQRKDLEIKLTFTADVLPAKQAAIFSKVSGYIRRIHADRGDFVKTGQLLVEIDDQELQASLEQARATLLSGQAGLEMAKSSLEGQRANLARARAVADNDGRQAERMKTLFERGLVSATDWENARTNADSSRANVHAAEAQITTSESQVRLSDAQLATYRASLNLAQTNLANTRLLAPFEGYISQRNLDQGAAVNAQSAGTSTTSVGILTVQDIATVKVQIEVPERDIARIKVGAPVSVVADPYAGESFSGTVARVTHSLDPRTRTMGIEVEIPNPGGKLKPGMFARVEALVDKRANALTIPVEAIRLGEAKPAVMVVRNGIVEDVPVELGVSDARSVEVLNGVSEADQVILQGKDLVKPKQKVRTTPATGQ
jgi:membrane fusion protein (multidrug efflux system)